MNNFTHIAREIKQLAVKLGFAKVGITDTDLMDVGTHLKSWLQNNCYGEMQYLLNNQEKRIHPQLLMSGTKSIICCLMRYSPPTLANGNDYIAAFAKGHNYHKLIRKRLELLAQEIQEKIGNFNYRVFCGSAPVLEKALAAKAGLGWIGKNTLLLDQRGSYFFLGELYTDLPLPMDKSVSSHCGNCRKCIENCPTKALISPYKLDVKRCIAYLTIEYKGIISEELRSLIGTRIFGCDICQQTCPWNRFALKTLESKLQPQAPFLNLPLHKLMLWDEAMFLEKTSGFAMRRLGYECWLRNVAVALGNAPKTEDNIKALGIYENHTSFLVREHVSWALRRLMQIVHYK